jgi:hypothetical protein
MHKTRWFLGQHWSEGQLSLAGKLESLQEIL